LNTEAVNNFLAEIQPALIAAVTDGVRAHVAKLQPQEMKFYGYALLPGEPYDISSLVVATNSEGDIKVPPTDDQYRYYRFSVDEWMHWDHNEFVAAKALLTDANKRFASMHTPTLGNYEMDEFEIAYSNGLLKALVSGLNIAKAAGVFGGKAPFLVVWISDSDETIMTESVKHLNAPAIANEFMAEFG
jgi:hypothetical protein